MRRTAALALCLLSAACPGRSEPAGGPAGGLTGAGLPAREAGVSASTAPPEREHIRARPPRVPQGRIVFYRLNPDWRKVDRYCGAWDRSYVVREVHMPEGNRRFLTRALRALLHGQWDVPRKRLEGVTITKDHANVHLRSMRGLGFASASCGGNAFLGSLERTVFQFDSIRSFQIDLHGSCTRFGNYMQAGPRCIRIHRAD